MVRQTSAHRIRNAARELQSWCALGEYRGGKNHRREKGSDTHDDVLWNSSSKRCKGLTTAKLTHGLPKPLVRALPVVGEPYGLVDQVVDAIGGNATAPNDGLGLRSFVMINRRNTGFGPKLRSKPTSILVARK